MAVDATATRQAVLSTTLDLVAEAGLGAVTIARVADRSGVSNGSIYHHFGSREGLLLRLHLDCFARLGLALAPALDDRPAEECLRDLVARFLAWVAAEPGPATVVYGVPLEPAMSGTGELAAGKAAIAAPLYAWFAARAAAGELRAVPAWAVDPVVLGPVHETARRWLATRDELATVTPVVADAVWAIVAPR